MRRIITTAVSSLLLVTMASEDAAAAKKCPVDSIKVGAVCVDKYEGSVWSTGDSATIKKIQQGKIDDAADLAAAVQLGVIGDDYGAACADNGTTDCNTSNPLETRVAGGSRADCVSDVGAFDTVGNVIEMTADWDETSIGGGESLDASFGFDLVSIGIEGGGGGTGEPASIVRGGAFGFGPANAGVFTIGTNEITSTGGQGAGFRCAR